MTTLYQRNDYVINSHINLNFEDLLEMTPSEFKIWVVDMRAVLTESWDKFGCPPRTGKTKSVIIKKWNEMETFPVHKYTHTDSLDSFCDDVIINKSRLGSEVDQFFENMFKTRINYTDKDNGYSIYDLVSDPKRLEQVYKGSLRHFRRDSFYSHALSTIKNSSKYSVVSVSNGSNWIEAFFTEPQLFGNKDFFLEEVKIREGLNTGYFQLEQSEILQISSDEVTKYKECGWLKYKHHSTFDIENMGDDKLYSIRMYSKGNKIFPSGFKAFRIGYIQPAVNFPPGTAKYLYEKYTKGITGKIKIYDPSAGWGGRILGAMSIRDDRTVHYIGTDPNPDNFFDDGTSRYSNVADFYNQETYRGNSFFSDTNTYEIHQDGSEEIHNNLEFMNHAGEIDLIFTSPPYFNREAYSDDENQSYKKHGDSYESWRDGFLKPTLQTCCDVLKCGGYLLWNIADILVKDKYIPLESDSRKFIEDNGLVFVEKIKMAMEGMPGQNRLDEDGKPKCKNYCMVNDRYYKYDPVYIFRKEQ